MRTIVRAAVILGCVLVVLGLAALLAVRLYGRGRLAQARDAFGRQGLSLDLGSYQPPDVPESENAASRFLAGAGALVGSKDDFGFIGRSARLASAEWDDAREARVRNIVASNRVALQALDAGAALARSSYGVEYRAGAEAPLPAFIPLRRASAVLLARGRAAVRAGDGPTVLQTTRTLTRLAGSLMGEPLLLTQLVAESIESDGVVLVADAAVAPRTAADTIVRLREGSTPRDRILEVRRSLGFEAVAAVAALRGPVALLETQPAPAGGRAPERLFPSPLLMVPGYVDLTEAVVLETALGNIALLERPVAVLIAPDLPQPSGPMWPHRAFVANVTPTVRGAAFQARLNLAGRQLVAAGLSLRTDALATGSYPAHRPSDAALNAPNALTGLPLEYTVEPGGGVRLEIPGIPARTPQDLVRGEVLSLRLPEPEHR